MNTITINLDDFLGELQKKHLESILTNPVKVSKSEDELLDIAQVCQLLGICKATLHNWKKQGLLPFYRIGRVVKFKKSEVLDSLKKIDRRAGS